MANSVQKPNRTQQTKRSNNRDECYDFIDFLLGPAIAIIITNTD